MFLKFEYQKDLLFYIIFHFFFNIRKDYLSFLIFIIHDFWVDNFFHGVVNSFFSIILFNPIFLLNFHFYWLYGFRKRFNNNKKKHKNNNNTKKNQQKKGNNNTKK